MVYIVGANGVNPPENPQNPKSKLQHDNRFERNVDFQNTPDPNEVIGRSVVQKNKNNKFDYKPLNEKEYKKLLAKINEQLEQFPDIQEKIRNVNLNQARVQLLNRLLNSEYLLNNDMIYDNLGDLLLNYKDNMIPFADRVYNDEKLCADCILDDVICAKFSKQQSDAKCKLLDKIISEQTLYEKLSPESINLLCNYASTPEDVDAQFYFVKKIYENEKLPDKQNIITNNIPDIKKNNVYAKLNFINDYSNSKELQKAGFGLILNDFIHAIENQNQYNVAQTIFSDKDLYNNFDIINSAVNLIQASENEHQAEIAIKFLENKDLHGREENATNIASLIGKTNNDFMRGLIVNKLVEEKDLLENENVLDLIMNSFGEQDGLQIEGDERNAKNEFLYNIISSPEIIKDKDLLEIAKKLHLLLRDPSDAGVLASPKVLNYIKNTANGHHYKVYTDMENSTYNIETDKNLEKFVQKFKVEGDDIEVIETKANRRNKQTKKEFPDGSYIVSKKRDDGTYQKTIYDSKGVQQYSEVIKKDRQHGQYSIKGYKRGLNEPMEGTELASSRYYGSHSQGRKIERNFSSEDGSNIQYKVIKGPSGSMMDYNITDPDNKNLLSVNRTFRKIDPEHNISTLNGDTYEIELPRGKAEIAIVTKTDKNGNKETISLDKKQLDPSLFTIYRYLPGDAFFALKKHNIRVYMNGMADDNNACFSPELRPDQLKHCTKKQLQENAIYGNSISISQSLKYDVFSFMHELGHALDHNNGTLSENDKELREIISNELREYRKTSSPQEEEAIDYFIDPAFGNTSIESCIAEIIAENSAIASGAMNSDNDKINDRSIILQKHFPKTSAYILNKLYE